jgi:hypothetical protein
MARFKLHLICVSFFILALIFSARSSSHTDSSPGRAPGPLALDSSYRSRSTTHKVIVQASEWELRDAILAEGGATIEDYGAFALMNAPDAMAGRVGLRAASGSAVRDDMNLLLLRARAFDTTEGEPVSLSSFGEADASEEQLYLVQMIGPVKDDWVSELKSAGEILSYVPNNAYLVRANAEGLSRINRLKSADRSFIQWAGPFKPDYKIAPEISLASDQEVSVTVQFVGGGDAGRDIETLGLAPSSSLIGPPSNVLNFTNVHLKVPARSLADLARNPNVVWVEPWTAPVLLDERQNLIVAGSFAGNQLNQPGYLAWLRAKGLAVTPDFIVDVADSGLDRGVLDPAVLHKDFLNPAGLARVAYARYFGAADDPIPASDSAGHGTINSAIIGGYNVDSGFPYTDSEGYSLGLGVHPFARLGTTRIFAPDYTNPPLPAMVDMMYRDGARISSNSWGAYNNNYTTDSQTYDSLVRDARRGEAGNQEMTVIFSAGNKGAGGNLTAPGTAKNIIMVGASESLRPGLDGCKVDSEGANDINSLIDFSSGGPTNDGRKKPEIVAPGTHIQGARSQDRGYTAGGVCAPSYPLGQTLYTWSSGTSHAAPAVAGAAALVRQFFQQSVGHPPSPAMVKAYLTNSTMYMNGRNAGDSLPGDNQGWGLLNVGRALDDVPRILVDQDQVLSSTGQVVTVRGRISDPTKPFRVSLAWTDAPGTPAANPVVNDLDLQVDVGGKTYLGNRFSGPVSTEGGLADHLNNIEAVWAPAGAAGDFVVRITGGNITGDGVPGNGDTTDQDFALVVYNGQAQDGGAGGGAGGGGPVDTPPTVNLKYPNGGEKLTVGSVVRIIWDASDDKGIQSQRIDFSADGSTFSTIGAVDGKARSFDWHIPAIPTPFGKIRLTALDGVNLPVSSVSAGGFEVINGPPDNSPPQVALLSPNTQTIVGGGLAMNIKWKESDNVGVIQRVIELSTDNGGTFQQIINLTSPSSGELQSYDWQIPASLSTDRAKVRITVYDGSGNSATITHAGRFEIWPMPIITEVTYNDGGKPQLEISGRYFRNDQVEIYVDGKKLKKIRWDDKFYEGNGMSRKVFSADNKLSKRVPLHEDVMIEIRVPMSGQVSPAFEFRRRRPSQ